MIVARSIFISYRRRDSVDITGRIYDRLVAQFGLDSVFKDVDAIPFGVDFRKHLEREVSHCPALLAIIGPDWLNAANDRNLRRLDDPSDWVRIEIETALKRDSVVIPVLVGGARLPKEAELPKSLKGLAYRQSAVVRHDPDFHRDVDRLIQRIEEVFKGLTLTGSPAAKPTDQPPPYATLIDDLATALTSAHQPEPSAARGKMGRRRWLRLMGWGLLGGAGTLAARRGWPLLRQAYAHNLPEQLPQLATMTDRLQSAAAAAKADLQATATAEPASAYAYKSVTVDQSGMPLYQTQFTTSFYEEVPLQGANDGAEIPLVAISGGRFLYGHDGHDRLAEAGQRSQTIAEVAPFWMGVFPITQRQWRVVAELPPVQRELNPQPAHFVGDEYPVEQVSWHDAVEFCQRLSRYTGQRFRLPTETEWEFACRAKTTTPFHFGETLTPDLANYDGRHAFPSEVSGTFRGKTTPVGYFQSANDFGLYDMHGNVLEWCADRWVEPADSLTDGEPAEPSPTEPPLVEPSLVEPSLADQPPLAGPLPQRAADFAPLEARVLRGGSWKSPPQHCHSAYRMHRNPEIRSDTLGFRIVREMRVT